MEISNIVGYMAAFLTSAAFAPQAIKTLKEKSAKDISLVMYLVFESGIILWFTYGILIKDLPIICANAVTLVFSTMILTMKLKYK